MLDTMKLRHDRAALYAFAATGLALITILSVWKLKQFKYRLLTESGGAMFYGMLVGFAVRCLSSDDRGHMENRERVCTCHRLNGTSHILLANITSQEHRSRHVGKISQSYFRCSSPFMENFDLEVLFNLFLPPIIFYGGYTLNQKRFIKNLGPVLTYAFLGTMISCLCIGACTYGFTRLMVLLDPAKDGEFFLTDCLLFGAIMSATDPVSVLGLLSDLHVDLDLHTLLFGESVLNDAVAIVLTHAIATYDQMGTGHVFDPTAFIHSIGFFLGVFVGSFFLGFIFSVITALLTKFTRLRESPLLETSVFLLLSWSSFLSAEASGLSGIVAVLFCGLSQARYTRLNLSPEGRTRSKHLFEVLNFLGEIFIFSYMGCMLLMFDHRVYSPLLISGAFISIFISRACNIYPLSFLLNLGRTNKIPYAFQHFMTFAGLRGAVAFNLAVRDMSTGARCNILTTTLLLVAFTIWVLGAAADPLVRRLDIRVGENADEDSQDSSSQVADTTRGLWHRLDYIYLKPVLTHCGPPLTDSLPQCCGVFARVFCTSKAQECEEQLCETEPDDTAVNLEKAELASPGSDSGSQHREDLLEGDLGLGTSPALVMEA
ncbi:sodium/hydrogen exchanger 9-like [Xenentodon cancila]